jgi:predicted Fe-Mo cluster-binding NifX family protein
VGTTIKVLRYQEHDMEELVHIQNSIAGMATMNPNKIQKISERMVEMERANNSLGRSNTQTTNQLMTLTMLTDSPYRRLRQCLAQIERKKEALRSSYFNHQKLELEIKEWEKEDTELSRIKIAEARANMESSKVYIEGALKEIAIFQDAYEEIRKNNNIPVLWDEEDAELDEIRHHIRQAFRQSHRDMILTGSISQGNAEYLEQYGIHLQTARNYIKQYIDQCEGLIAEKAYPTIDHLYEFLDKCVETFGEEYIKTMHHIGITELVRSEWLFKNNVNK